MPPLSHSLRPLFFLLSCVLFAVGCPAQSSPSPAAGASAVLVDFNPLAPDFRLVKADPSGGSAGRITGSIPAGWGDSSAWSKSRVDYRLIEDSDGGQKLLAVHVGEIGAGPVSLSHPVSDYGDGSLFKLRIRARASGNVPLEFGLRDISKPWAYLWSQTEQLSSSLQDHEYFFTLDHNTQPVGFWWDFKGVGEVDIASVHLERASKEQLMAELKARYPDNGPRNILRTTRLPLGLQSGWVLDLMRVPNTLKTYNPLHPPTNRDPLVEADPQAIGISGSPALHVHADDRVSLWSEPFAIPVPTQKYTGSVYVKGTGSGELIIRRGQVPIVRQKFQATPEWQRVEAPFDTRLGERFYALDIEFTGELWFDAWQVGPGEKAGPYVTQLPAEISLACVARDTGPERIEFTDEPPLVDYRVTTTPKSPLPAGVALHARVVNVYGESVETAPIALSSPESNHGQINFGVFPQRPLGPFRIETWVQDARGAHLSPYQEMVIHRMTRPRFWGQDAPDSPFGLHADGDMPHLIMAKAMGFNWVRSHDAGRWWSSWYFLERQPGQWHFEDEAVQRFRHMHLKILSTLGTSPVWAGYLNGQRHSEYFDQFSQPKDPAQFENYVQKYVTHYRGVIDTYEVWNEPWNAAWFWHSYDTSKTDRMAYQPSADQAGDYANLVKLTRATLKSLDPNLTLVGLNTTGTTDHTKTTPDINGQDWSLMLDKLRSDEQCDVLSYHQYSTEFMDYPGDAVDKAFQAAVGPFLRRGVKKPVWMTEGCAINGYIASGFYHYTLPYTDGEDVWDTANRSCRFFDATLANGAVKAFIYTMVPYKYWYFGAVVDCPWLALVTEDGYPHPAGDAFSAMAWALEGTRFVKRVSLGNKVIADLYAGPQRTVAVLAPPQNGATLTFPAEPGWKVDDLFGNPTGKTPVNGNRLIYVQTAAPVADLERELGQIGTAPGS